MKTKKKIGCWIHDSTPWLKELLSELIKYVTFFFFQIFDDEGGDIFCGNIQSFVSTLERATKEKHDGKMKMINSSIGNMAFIHCLVGVNDNLLVLNYPFIGLCTPCILKFKSTGMAWVRSHLAKFLK